MRAFLSNYELRIRVGLPFEYHITFRRMNTNIQRNKEGNKMCGMFTSSDIIAVYLCLTIFVVFRCSPHALTMAQNKHNCFRAIAVK